MLARRNWNFLDNGERGASPGDKQGEDMGVLEGVGVFRGGRGCAGLCGGLRGRPKGVSGVSPRQTVLEVGQAGHQLLHKLIIHLELGYRLVRLVTALAAPWQPSFEPCALR